MVALASVNGGACSRLLIHRHSAYRINGHDGFFRYNQVTINFFNTLMILLQYVWFTWASAFLIPWVMLFLVFPQQRRTMWTVSLATAPFCFNPDI
jgi:hypothetical protein